MSRKIVENMTCIKGSNVSLNLQSHFIVSPSAACTYGVCNHTTKKTDCNCFESTPALMPDSFNGAPSPYPQISLPSHTKPHPNRAGSCWEKSRALTKTRVSLEYAHHLSWTTNHMTPQKHATILSNIIASMYFDQSSVNCTAVVLRSTTSRKKNHHC